MPYTVQMHFRLQYKIQHLIIVFSAFNTAYELMYVRNAHLQEIWWLKLKNEAISSMLWNTFSYNNKNVLTLKSVTLLEASKVANQILDFAFAIMECPQTLTKFRFESFVSAFQSKYSTKSNLNPRLTSSLFGQVASELTKQSSNLQERNYLHFLWTERIKVSWYIKLDINTLILITWY